MLTRDTDTSLPRPSTHFFRKPWVWFVIVATTFAGGVYGDLWAYRNRLEIESRRSDREAFAGLTEKQLTRDEIAEIDETLDFMFVAVGAALAFTVVASGFALLEILAIGHRLLHYAPHVEWENSMGTQVPA